MGCTSRIRTTCCYWEIFTLITWPVYILWLFERTKKGKDNQKSKTLRGEKGQNYHISPKWLPSILSFKLWPLILDSIREKTYLHPTCEAFLRTFQILMTFLLLSLTPCCPHQIQLCAPSLERALLWQDWDNKIWCLHIITSMFSPPHPLCSLWFACYQICDKHVTKFVLSYGLRL